MIAYSLNQDINSQKILEDIQKLIHSKVRETNNSVPLVLVIDIKEISQQDSNIISKIEYKQLDH